MQHIALVGTTADAKLGFRAELIKDLVAQGHKVFAFAGDYTDKTRAAISALGAQPVSYSVSRFGINPIQDCYTLLQLVRLFKQHRIDMSFCYFAKPVIFGSLAAKLAGVPYRVAKIEGLGRIFTVPASGDTLRARILRWVQTQLYRLALPACHTVFVLNPDDEQDLITANNIKVKRCINLGGIGINLEQYQPFTASGKIKFIFVGRLLPEKGIGYFIQAATLLRQQGAPAEFVVLGEPDNSPGAINRAQLQKLVEQGIIYYPGRVGNVSEYLRQSHVFVLPSYYREGVPRSTQEAMAAGLAIITTNVPGCRETVSHKDNGLLVPPHDVAALVAAMQQLIQQPGLAEQMGQRSRTMAEKKYDVRKINHTILQALSLHTKQKHE
ncbi:glycosyltransferase family 4 protein [Rheinheimera maricola]|uniref:Glycosyltransferase family 4 protein n=1 Tax=Rheinheimera maricola TaxID=2793282 RepID=A0ABS7X584_9GAMM|nr:glycosyltransferase family 4 protein [Rheinheimera maricola]MBZ9610305.1 glycosyltransferase family 4 protein [Rheinheimera maricola]